MGRKAFQSKVHWEYWAGMMEEELFALKKTVAQLTRNATATNTTSPWESKSVEQEALLAQLEIYKSGCELQAKETTRLLEENKRLKQLNDEIEARNKNQYERLKKHGELKAKLQKLADIAPFVKPELDALGG